MKRHIEEEEEESASPEPITSVLLAELMVYILMLRYQLEKENAFGLRSLFLSVWVLYPEIYVRHFVDFLLPEVSYVPYYMMERMNKPSLERLVNLRHLPFDSSFGRLGWVQSEKHDFHEFMTDMKWAKKWHNLTSITLANCSMDFSGEHMYALRNLVTLTIGYRSRTTFGENLSCLANLTHLAIRQVCECSLSDLDLISSGITRSLRVFAFSGTSDDGYITDIALAHMTSLVELEIDGNHIISDAGLLSLTGLRALSLRNNEIITDDCISLLTNLSTLNIAINRRITDASVRVLTNLVYLDISGNSVITSQGVSRLCNLVSLKLLHNDLISGEALQNMSHLAKLDLTACTGVRTLSPSLTRLSHLTLDHNNHIEDIVLAQLTGLRTLTMKHNTHITDSSLSLLTSLVNLDITSAAKITFHGSVRLLKQLKVIVLH